MTAVRALPNMKQRMDQVVKRQRADNINRDLTDARNMLRSPNSHATPALRWACSILETYGDGMDYLLADEMIHTLNRQERMAQRHHPDETPLDVLKRQGVRPVLAYLFIAIPLTWLALAGVLSL